MTTTPYFIESELQNFAEEFKDASERGRPIFLVRCKNLSSRATELELFAASYLLMNVFLMGMFHQRILKMLFIEERNKESLAPMLNAMRGVFHGGFSSLHEIQNWREMIASEFSLSAPALERLENAVEFIEGAGITDNLRSFHQAEIFLGVGTTGASHIIESSPFTVFDDDIFTSTIRTPSEETILFMPELFSVADVMQVRIDKFRQILVVELDCSKKGWLEAWVQNLEVIVYSKLFAGKI